MKELAAAAHAHGARIVLDAAQLAPHHPVSVQDLDVDWVAFSGHKLYAPFGSGVLAGRADWLQEARARTSRAAAPPARSPGARTAAWTSSGTPRAARHEAGSPERHRRLLHRLGLQGPDRGRLREPGRPGAAPDRDGPRRAWPRSPRSGSSPSSATTPRGSASSPSSSTAGTAPTSRRRCPPSTASASATACSAPTRWSAPCWAATRRTQGECGAPEAAPGERSLNAIRVSFGAGTPGRARGAVRAAR